MDNLEEQVVCDWLFLFYGCFDWLIIHVAAFVCESSLMVLFSKEEKHSDEEDNI